MLGPAAWSAPADQVFVGDPAALRTLHRFPGAVALEPDPRLLPVSTWRRLALFAGHFPPPYRPISQGEMAELISCPRRDDQEAGRRSRGLVVTGRVALYELGPGEVVPGESGLTGRGALGTLEPSLVAWSGPSSWLALTTRLEVPLGEEGRELPPGHSYARWPRPTGRLALDEVRGTRPVTRIAIPQAAAGRALGHWSLTAGWFPASVGVGLEGGGLTLDQHARSLPQVVLRRTRPLTWSGLLRWFDPEHVLLRVAASSSQDIAYDTESGVANHRDHPLFTQWLLTWDHRRWWRTTLVGSVMSVARADHALWPDIIQVNLPLLNATWNEKVYGPITDRLVSVIMEARWQAAPWPLLPRKAGRAWWEYAGEDYRPHDQVPLIPEISSPASQAGLELLDDRWDLGVEYLTTRHPEVLWYSNGGFAEGYIHHGLGLGHDLGGAAEAWTAVLRWRLADGSQEWTLRGRSASWDGRFTPMVARRRELTLGWQRWANRAVWSATAAWVEEELGDTNDHWWQARVAYAF